MKYAQLSVLDCNLKARLKVQVKQQRQKRCWKVGIQNMMLKGGARSGSVSRTTENKVLLLYYFLLRALLLLLRRNKPKEIQWFELCPSSLLKQNSCLINTILGWVIGSLWNLQESPYFSSQTWCSIDNESVGLQLQHLPTTLVLLCSWTVILLLISCDCYF